LKKRRSVSNLSLYVYKRTITSVESEYGHALKRKAHHSHIKDGSLDNARNADKVKIHQTKRKIDCQYTMYYSEGNNILAGAFVHVGIISIISSMQNGTAR
jgi:hypothetical protein